MGAKNSRFYLVPPKEMDDKYNPNTCYMTNQTSDACAIKSTLDIIYLIIIILSGIIFIMVILEIVFGISISKNIFKSHEIVSKFTGGKYKYKNK